MTTRVGGAHERAHVRVKSNKCLSSIGPIPIFVFAFGHIYPVDFPLSFVEFVLFGIGSNRVIGARE